MCDYCAVSSIESIFSLIPRVIRSQINNNGLDMCGYILPWLIEASKEQWIGEKKVTDSQITGDFTFLLVGDYNADPHQDRYAVFLSITAHHKNYREHEAFGPFFWSFAKKTQKNLDGCGTFEQTVEDGQAGSWRIKDSKYRIIVGAEDQPKLLEHILTMMLVETQPL